MPAKKTKTVQKKSAKKAPKKTASTKKPTRKVAAKKKPVSQTSKKAGKQAAKAKNPPKKAPAKKKATARPARKQVGAKKSAAKKPADSSTTSKTIVSRSSDAESSKSASIVFSLDDVEQLIAAKKQTKISEKPAPKAVKKTAAKPVPPEKPIVDEAPTEKRKLGAASLADILGFNPADKKKRTDLDESEIPKKWQKYYKLLIDLRAHVSDEINLHSSETLKHSSREDSGDLSGYGTHQADAGTDSFDRDFALSLVSSEQEALNEIEEAIMRIKNGTYGICEVTGKPIPAARLTAVPFTHYSVEGQAEYEKNLRRKSDRVAPGGLFGDTSDVPKITSSDDDDD